MRVSVREGRRGERERKGERDGKPGRFFKPLNNRPRGVPMPSHPSSCLLLLPLLLHQVATTSAAASLVSSVSTVRMSAGQLINANHPKDCLCSYWSYHSCSANGHPFFSNSRPHLLPITPRFVGQQIDSVVLRKVIDKIDFVNHVRKKMSLKILRKLFTENILYLLQSY